MPSPQKPHIPDSIGPDQPPQNVHLLSIGVDEYQDETIGPLPSAKNDAKALWNLFHGAPIDLQGRVLTGLEATVINVRSALAQTIRDVDTFDALFIYYSGKALSSSSKHLAAYDTRTDASSESNNALSLDELLRFLATSNAYLNVLLLDTSFSGDAALDAGKVLFSPMDDAGNEGNLSRLDGLSNSDRNFIVMTASQHGQSAMTHIDPDTKVEHGIFTKILLERLGAHSQPFNLLTELEGVRKDLMSHANTLQFTQDPQLRVFGTHGSIMMPGFQEKLPHAHFLDEVRAKVKDNKLDLSDTELTISQLSNILSAGICNNLISLKLKGNNLGKEGAMILSLSPGVQNLRYLSLRGNNIGPEGVRALAASYFLQNLISLNLWNNEIGDEGVKALAASSAFPKLTSINLRLNRIGPEGATALFASPHWRELAFLNMTHNDIESEGGQALLGATFIEGLTSLYIAKNGVPQDMIQELQGIVRENRKRLGFSQDDFDLEGDLDDIPTDDIPRRDGTHMRDGTIRHDGIPPEAEVISPSPKLVTITIGINEFNHPGIQGGASVRNDVVAFREAVDSHLNSSKNISSVGSLDSKNFKGLMHDAINNMQSGDIACFYIATHATLDGFLLCSDSDPDNLSDNNAVTPEMLGDIFLSYPDKHILIILDTSHSAGIAKRAIASIPLTLDSHMQSILAAAGVEQAAYVDPEQNKSVLIKAIEQVFATLLQETGSVGMILQGIVERVRTEIAQLGILGDQEASFEGPTAGVQLPRQISVKARSEVVFKKKVLPNYYVSRPQLEEEVQRFLTGKRNSPYLSVLGPPGVGKTALITHVIQDVDTENRFPDGVHWVYPVKNETPQDTLMKLLHALRADIAPIGFHDDVGTPVISPNVEAVKQALLDVLSDKTCLIVFEDIDQDMDVLVDNIAPQNRVITISRDHLYDFSALEVPEFTSDEVLTLLTGLGCDVSESPEVYRRFVDVCSNNPSLIHQRVRKGMKLLSENIQQDDPRDGLALFAHERDLDDIDMAFLVAEPSLRRVEHFYLAENRFTAAAMALFAQSPHIAAVTELGLSNNNVGDEGITHLAQSPHLNKYIHHLMLDHCGISGEGFTTLVRAGVFQNVVSLSVRGNLLNDDDIKVLVDEDVMPRLRRFEHDAMFSGYLQEALDEKLARNREDVRAESLEGAVVAVGETIDIYGETFLAYVEDKITEGSLELFGKEINALQFRALVNSDVLSRIHSLSLGGAVIDTERIQALAESPQVAHLTELSFVAGNIGDKGARTIANSPHLTNLTTLILGKDHIGDKGARAIAQSPYLTNLTQLDLSFNNIVDNGARALLDATFINNLTSLRLDGNGVGAVLYRQLQDKVAANVARIAEFALLSPDQQATRLVEIIEDDGIESVLSARQIIVLEFLSLLRTPLTEEDLGILFQEQYVQSISLGLRGTIGKLRESGAIHQEEGGHRYEVHSRIREYFTSRISQGDKGETHKVLAQFCRDQIEEILPSLPEDTELMGTIHLPVEQQDAQRRYMRFATEFVHHALELLGEPRNADFISYMDLKSDVKRIGSTVIFLLKSHLRYDEAREVADGIMEKFEIEDGIIDIRLVNHIGLLSLATGDVQKAREYFKRVGQLYEKSQLGVNGLNNLGIVCSDLGLYNEALEYYRQAITGFVKPLDGCYSKNNLGVLHGRMGDYDRATELIREALNIRRDFHEDQHPNIAYSFMCLGEVCGHQGKHEEALEHLQAAVDMNIKLFGDQHPRVAVSLDRLGEVYKNMGDDRTALHHLQQALAINRRVFGKDHPEIAINLNNIGDIDDGSPDDDYDYARPPSVSNALDAFHQALEMDRKFFGEKHPHIGKVLGNIGIAHASVRSIAYESYAREAIDHLMQAYEMLLFYFEESHRDVKKVKEAIDDLFQSDPAIASEFEDAIRKIHDEHLVIGTLRGGRESVEREDVADASDLERNACELIQQGEYDSARAILQEAIKLDPTHPQREEVFGFLLREDPSHFTSEQFLWRVRVWHVLSLASGFEPQVAEVVSYREGPQSTQDTPTMEVDSSPEETTPATEQVRSVDTVEESPAEGIVDVLKHLFILDGDAEEVFCTTLNGYFKEEVSGIASLDVVARWDETIRCRINYFHNASELTEGDLGSLLLSIGDDVSNWIALSPHSDVGPALEERLNTSLRKFNRPFQLQVWDQAMGIRGLFAHNTALYEKLYPGEDTPVKMSIDALRERIRPPLDLPEKWKRYLMQPSHLCMRHEDADALETLYAHHVDVYCKDEAKVDLQESFGELVRDWLDNDKRHILFLLGEFGDGKTAATYLLSRELADDYIQNPLTGWIPIRFPLRNYGQSPRAFIRERLEEFGASFSSWNQLQKSNKHRFLIIIDGFDEMSSRLDPFAITENISRLTELCDAFPGCKILITSRTHFFENKSDERNLIEWLNNPRMLYLASFGRKSVDDHLETFVREKDDPEMMERLRLLRTMNDPIGAASKALYLQMTKDVLDDEGLRDMFERAQDPSTGAELNQLTLYGAYVDKSLSRKSEIIASERPEVSPQEVVGNLKGILTRIALHMISQGREHVFLEELREDADFSFAQALWNIADPEVQKKESALRQVQIRSLLSRLSLSDKDEERSRMPVSFFHRSIGEYFAAQAVVEIFDDIEKGTIALNKLAHLHLNHEIFGFVVLMMQSEKAKYIQQLEKLCYGLKNRYQDDRLGANIVTLLYRLAGSLPGDDWSGMYLDSVDLSHADLSGKNFRGTTLRAANLDNANLCDADFRDTDVTGVRIEETGRIQSISLHPSGEKIIVVYDDNVVREWSLPDPHRPEPTTVMSQEKQAIQWVSAVHGTSAVAQTNNNIAYYSSPQRESESNQFTLDSRFRIAPQFSEIVLRKDTVLFMEDVRGKIFYLIDLAFRQRSVAMTSGEHMSSEIDIGSTGTYPVPPQTIATLKGENITHCEHLGSEAFITVDHNNILRIMDPHTQQPLIQAITLSDRVDSIAAYTLEDDTGYLFASGSLSGGVNIWHLDASEQDNWHVKHVLKYTAHKGSVKSLTFAGKGRLVSGGIDKSISVIDFKLGEGTNQEARITPLALSIQCRGLQIDGLKGPEEHEKLLALINKANA